MGIIAWFKGLLPTTIEAPSPSTYTAAPKSRVSAPFDWQRKVVILSVAPNAYKEWVTIEDLYQAFKERMEEE